MGYVGEMIFFCKTRCPGITCGEKARSRTWSESTSMGVLIRPCPDILSLGLRSLATVRFLWLNLLTYIQHNFFACYRYLSGAIRWDFLGIVSKMKLLGETYPGKRA